MIQLSMTFDGGAETYKRGIDKELTALSNFQSLFDLFIKYFEGKDTGLSGLSDTKSPIMKYLNQKVD